MKLRFFFSVFLSISLFGCSPKAPVIWWQNVNAKARTILHVEAEYTALKKEHEQLQTDFYKLENEYMAIRAEHGTKQEVHENLQETGSKTGRSPASIDYKVPSGLEPEQAYSLAFEHMREKRFAQAALTFDSFLWMPEGAAFQNSNSYYSAGVAWFQLSNFNKAKKCFAEALTHTEGDERAKVAHKVDLWMRVLERKLGTNKEVGVHETE